MQLLFEVEDGRWGRQGQLWLRGWEVHWHVLVD